MTEAKKATPAKAATPVVSDKATDLPENTEAAVTEAVQGKPGDELKDVNPATSPGDNLAPGATLTENAANLPGSGTGYHCGHCGQSTSSTGEHFDGNGDVVTTPHANTLVLADNWPVEIERDNAESAERYANRKTEKATEKKTDNTK